MKSRKKVIVITVICVILLSMVALGNSPLPGTESDPVVTVSYVESKMNEIKGYIDQRLNNLSLEDDSEISDDDIIVSDNQTETFKVIDISKNQKLIGMESTEIILRAGTAVAIDNGVDGLSDITLGKDLKGGESIQKNHLLIVPRDDGRGLLATSEVWVMVKGTYTIK